MNKTLLSLLMAIFAIVAPQQLCASTLVVTSNSNSGIENANFTGSLKDGTVLGFYRNSSSVYFCGAISHASSITIPDSISFSIYAYSVKYCGYSSSYDIDLDSASSVTSLTLPSSITNIYSYIPSQITDLHLLSTSVPSLSYRSSISSSTTIWVPQSTYETYKSYVNNSSSNWYGKSVHYEGWQPTPVTINETTAGTFANLLLNQVSQWTDVEELIVIGHMNETDMTYLSRLDNVIKIDLSQTDITTIKGCADLIFLKTIILPSTVTSVQDNAFKNCTSLSSINLPNVISIGEKAFYQCYSLDSISLPQVTVIGEYAFYNCTSLLSISLPNALTIGRYAFYQCSSLQSASLPKVTTIENEMFEYCTTLNEVSIPNVETIGSSAFYNCDSLMSISLPNVTSIGSSAFSSCNSLSSILLSPYLQDIASSAFWSTSLDNVYCYAVAPISTSAFSSSVVSDATLYVPEISRKSYMTHDDWSNFAQTLTLDYDASILAIYGDFSLDTTKGLDSKPTMIVYTTGHAAIDLESELSLHYYFQQVDTKSTASTLITQSKITADSLYEYLYLNTKKWNFISFPYDVDVKDICAGEDDAQWVIRKYSGLNRANLTGDTWQNVGAGATLYAGEGYILHCTSSTNQSQLWFIFPAKNNNTKNGIFAHTDVEIPLQKYASTYAHNRSWNLVGNPYPCYYNTTAISHNGVITAWNGNGYTAYSLLDDEYYLRPNEAFFVQCPEDATSMTFAASGRSHTADNTSSSSYAPARTNEENRLVYNLSLSNNQYQDKARVVINEKASIDYELSCDASKFMSSNTNVPQLYIVEGGQKLAIDERPLANGEVSVGTYIGKTGTYTIALASNPDVNKQVLLTDNETGIVTDLTLNSYSFSANQGCSDSRFLLTFTDGTTDLQRVQKNRQQEGVIYNMQGQELPAPQSGVNIINSQKVLVK